MFCGYGLEAKLKKNVEDSDCRKEFVKQEAAHIWEGVCGIVVLQTASIDQVSRETLWKRKTYAQDVCVSALGKSTREPGSLTAGCQN